VASVPTVGVDGSDFRVIGLVDEEQRAAIRRPTRRFVELAHRFAESHAGSRHHLDELVEGRPVCDGRAVGRPRGLGRIAADELS